MTLRSVSLATLTFAAVALTAHSALADDSGYFLTRLGQDTTAVEHYTRTASRNEVDQVGRAPRVLRRHYVYDYSNGTISKFTMVVTPPGSTTPTQNIDAAFGPDSMRMQIKTGSAAPQNVVLAWPAGTVVIAGSSPWSVYEGQIMKLTQGKSDSLHTGLYFLGADALNVLSLHKLGKDSVLVWNDHMDVYHARIDKSGHVLGVLPISGTQKFSVERLDKIDVDAMAAAFADREKAGTGIGMLSPRDTVNVTNAGGATLMIDYGRPAKRGRAIFGGIVPYGDVWRTGANAATQFKTDKALDFGGTVVPPGFYTLWSLVTPTGWKLIVNGETGQWGTAHKADKDLYTIDMKVGTLPQPAERFTISVDPGATGGTLNLDWDTTRASAAFTVKP